MKVLIMGCGRVGARIAATLAASGHDVTILDISPAAFRRLPPDYRGEQGHGNRMNRPSPERAGIASADAFVAGPEGDNRNYFASQVARDVYGVRRVLCRI